MIPLLTKLQEVLRDCAHAILFTSSSLLGGSRTGTILLQIVHHLRVRAVSLHATTNRQRETDTDAQYIRRPKVPRRCERAGPSQPIRIRLPPRISGAARLQHEHGVDKIADVVEVEGNLKSFEMRMMERSSDHPGIKYAPYY